MAAQRVDVHGLLLDQELADPMQLADALLLDRLHRHEAHGRPRHRLADRLRVGGVVLVALDVGLHVLGRDQTDPVAQLDELASPMVGAAAGLHADQARRQAGEELQHLAARQLLAQHRPALRVGAVHLEPGLCQVEADGRNLRHGRSPCGRGSHTWHDDAEGGGRPFH
jgi:hypothetical protein